MAATETVTGTITTRNFTVSHTTFGAVHAECVATGFPGHVARPLFRLTDLTETTASFECTTFTEGTSVNISVTVFAADTSEITAGALTTVVRPARRALTKVTIPYTAFVTAAQSGQVTLCTLPAMTLVMHATLVVTQAFSLGGSNLTVAVGTAADPDMLVEEIAPAETTAGDADAELGAGLIRATAVQGGKYLASSTALVIEMVSDADNLGTGSVTSLTAGAATLWLITEELA